jgi:hypothetical protein
VVAALDRLLAIPEEATEAIPCSTPSPARAVVVAEAGVAVPQAVGPEAPAVVAAATHPELAALAPADRATQEAMRLHLASSLVAVVGAVQMQ